MVAMLESRRSEGTNAVRGSDSAPSGPATLAPTTTHGRPLSDLVSVVESKEIRGDRSVRIDGLAYRADEARPDTLFFCVLGTKLDGHDFAEEAVLRGATALLVERWLPAEAVQVLVPSVRAAMGPISSEFY